MAELGQKSFERMGKVTAAGAKVANPVFGRLVERITRVNHRDDLDWAGDADAARLAQEPVRARLILRLAVLFFVAIIVWAAYAEVDEVTRGDARVVPSTQLQIVQSVDGGVVEELLVREGDVVEADQVLVRIDPTRFVSSAGETNATVFALQAKAARLEALTRGTSFNPSLELMRSAPDIVANEQRLYESRRAELSAQLNISQQQLSQRQQELGEMRARQTQAERGLALTEQELNATRPLTRTGAVSEVEVLRLERDVSRLRGERDQATAQIARVQAAIQEATRRIEEVELTARNQMRTELNETVGRLNALRQSSRALQDKVKKAEVRAPVRGTVKRLLVNTVGGVVQPGKEVVEIVPLDDTLILEAQINPRDIGFLTPKQAAVVKFTAYDFAVYGGLTGKVISIRPDSVVDDKGNAAYLVRVKTDEPKLRDDLPIIPGMVAQVDILTGKKTVLSYLLKPVLRAKANALSER
jgi:membrane fusion protein, adhesin transport system